MSLEILRNNSAPTGKIQKNLSWWGLRDTPQIILQKRTELEKSNKNNMKALLFALVLTLAFCDDRVQIDMYTESLCPDCIDFVVNSLKIAINTKDFDKIANLNFYPYGNAHETQTSSGW